MPMEPALANAILMGLRGWWNDPYSVEKRNFVLYSIMPKVRHLGITDHMVRLRLNGEVRGEFVIDDGSPEGSRHCFDSSSQVVEWVRGLQEAFDLSEIAAGRTVASVPSPQPMVPLPSGPPVPLMKPQRASV